MKSRRTNAWNTAASPYTVPAAASLVIWKFTLPAKRFVAGICRLMTRFPIAPSKYKFAQHGKCGAILSELLPHTARIVDDIAIIRSMHTEQINHDPAHTFMNTGSGVPGRPSMGSWWLYGLGAETDDLPGFVVLTSAGRGGQMQPIAARQWHSGFLPSRFQGRRSRLRLSMSLPQRDPRRSKLRSGISSRTCSPLQRRLLLIMRPVFCLPAHPPASPLSLGPRCCTGATPSCVGRPRRDRLR